MYIIYLIAMHYCLQVIFTIAVFDYLWTLLPTKDRYFQWQYQLRYKNVSDFSYSPTILCYSFIIFRLLRLQIMRIYFLIKTFFYLKASWHVNINGNIPNTLTKNKAHQSVYFWIHLYVWVLTHTSLYGNTRRCQNQALIYMLINPIVQISTYFYKAVNTILP